MSRLWPVILAVLAGGWTAYWALQIADTLAEPDDGWGWAAPFAVVVVVVWLSGLVVLFAVYVAVRAWRRRPPAS